MKPSFSKIFVIVFLVVFLTISTTNPAGAQPSDPPIIMENGEVSPDPNRVPTVLTERTDTSASGGNNGINAVTSWWSLSGTTFVPSSSGILYNYGGNGCVDTGANFDVWRGSVNLPHGSTITSMWFNYLNETADPTDSTIYLRRYSYAGTFDDIFISFGSVAGIGNHSTISYAGPNNIVNNNDYNYVLVWTGDVNQNLCGVNVAYTPPPIFLNALPLINR